MRYYARIAGVAALMSAGALLPACASSGSSASDTLPPIVTTTSTTTTPPTTTTIPLIYVVKKGESLFSIAKQFGISSGNLAAFNGITNPDKIQAGQKLKLPQPGDVEPTTSTPAATP